MSESTESLQLLARLWEKYKGKNLERVDLIEQAVLALLEGNLSDELRREATCAAHSLAGSAGTYGFLEASRIARDIEELCGAEAPLEMARGPSLSQSVMELRRLLETPMDQGAAALQPDDDRPLILVLEADTDLIGGLIKGASGRGFRAQMMQDITTLRRRLGQERPALIVMGLADRGIGPEESALLADLGQASEPIPVILLSERAGFLDRVQAARMGAKGYLQKPVRPTEILEAAAHLLVRLKSDVMRVMAVDDDPSILAALQTLLSQRNIELMGINDPTLLWDALQEQTPDLLVLDIDMPNVNGLELCRALRNDATYRELPILILTARGGQQTIEHVFATGADDYVQKPIVGLELVTRLTSRLERARLQRAAMEEDYLTGLPNRRKFLQRVGQLLRDLHRDEQKAAIALVSIDRFKQVNSLYGNSSGDLVLRRVAELLQRNFRGEDFIARWGSKEFAVAMAGMGQAAGVERLASVLEELRGMQFTSGDDASFGVTFRGGVAEYPTNGVEVETLLRAADDATRQAKEAGRNRVLPVGWRTDAGVQAGLLDVLVVDDDETLSGLLLHALQTRGYHARCIANGLAALEALTGEQERLHPRTVILDVELPGMDGFSILRRLAEKGITEQVRVILLTRRTSEQEVLKGLQGGAYDYVAKPFSVPILLQRIQKALEG